MKKQSYLCLTREGEVIKISGNSSAVMDSGRSFPIHNSEFKVEARCCSCEEAVKTVEHLDKELSLGKSFINSQDDSLRLCARYVRKDELLNILSGIGAEACFA